MIASPRLLRQADGIDRGLGLLHQGQTDAAVKLLGRVARNNLLDADAQQAYGQALHLAWRFEEAIEHFNRALRLGARHWGVYQNLGAAYHGLKRLDEAHAATLESIRLNPDNAQALYHLADVHLIWGEMDEAARYYRQALDVDPYMFDAWIGYLFCLDLIPSTTGEIALAERKRLAETFEQPLMKVRRPHPNTLDPDRKLRLGFLSGDFRDHTAAYMFGPIYEFIDRDQFQTVSYADIVMEDSVGQWFKSASNGWRNVYGCSAQQIDAAIRADEIDILIDTAGYTNGGHLINFAAKPAPLQVTAWGYLTGSGLENSMDAILVDDVLVPPEHQHHFAERMLRVPYALGFTGVQYDTPILPRPVDRPLTFGHLGRSDKISDTAVDLWADVLRAHPGSRMLLKDRGLSQERTATRITAMFDAAGIDPSRIELRGATDRASHMSAYNDVDVILDSIPQGGGTTTMEALWMGTPVLTMLGPRITSRIAGTTLHAIGRADWIAPDRDAYVRRAGTLADVGGEHLREEIRTSIVCDGPARARQFGDALRVLWREHCERQEAV